MESSAVQLRLICTSIAFGISMSCTNQSNDIQNSNDSIANESRSGSLDSGLPDNDSVLNYRNGVNPNVEQDGSDTIQLPNPILEAIEDDNILKNAAIMEKIKKEDSGATLYEVLFYPVNGKEERVTFDANGNIKQKP